MDHNTYSSDSDDEFPFQIHMDGDSLAPYQGSQPETVHAVCELAELQPSDVLYDLGCGDARIPIYASEHYGCKSVGIEMFVFDKAQDRLNLETRANDQRAVKLKSLVNLRNEDATTCPMDDCTVCVMFLLPEGLVQITERLEQLLDDGVRIVTIFWGIKNRKPIKTTQINNTTLFLYTKDSEHVN